MAAASGEGPQEMMDGERPPGAGAAAGWVGSGRLVSPLENRRSRTSGRWGDCRLCGPSAAARPLGVPSGAAEPGPGELGVLAGPWRDGDFTRER